MKNKALRGNLQGFFIILGKLDNCCIIESLGEANF